jgi:DNA-binding NarL/FixJ family response regulator
MAFSEPDAPRTSTTVSRALFGSTRFLASPVRAAPSWAAKLTPAEHGVLALLAEGLSNAEIAAARGCGVPTVAKQISALKEKTGHGDRHALVTQGRRLQRSDTSSASEGVLPARTLTDEEAAALWTGMMEGRCSVVDEVDSGGIRLLVVRESTVGARRCALTPGERAVLSLILTGRTNKLIALELGIGAPTVSLRVRSILAKIGVHDRPALALLAETLRATTLP